MTLTFLMTGLLLTSCVENDASTQKKEATSITKEKREYWYTNPAEISSYELSQARYGEIHSGKAVLIFVTEAFSQKSSTKADSPSDQDISILKLNHTKKFNTGIYPYSMMTSTFFPFENGDHSLKVSSTSQEWCGHTYMELVNKKKYEGQVFSYFEGESEQDLSLSKNHLEDDFWSIIRIDPDKLPLGKMKVIPSFFYLRLSHKETKAYNCTLSSATMNEFMTSYTMHYPKLERTMKINYETKFPHRIISWEEIYKNDWGKDEKSLKTSAKLIQTIKTDYWNKHSNKDLEMRKHLGLE